MNGLVADSACAALPQALPVEGHVWQGRFKAFPIEQDEHLLRVLRYIERNPLRAKLVVCAEDWRWSSWRWWIEPLLLPFVEAGPVPRGPDWVAHVNAPQTEAELTSLRQSVARGRPYGNDTWTRETAAALGLESTLRRWGRPPKPPPETGDEDNGPTLYG